MLAIDEVNRTFSFSIDSAPGTPVDEAKGYVCTWKVFEVTNPAEGKTAQTFLVQSSVWASGDSQVILDFCNPVYGAAINAFKAFMENQ